MSVPALHSVAQAFTLMSSYTRPRAPVLLRMRRYCIEQQNQTLQNDTGASCKCRASGNTPDPGKCDRGLLPDQGEPCQYSASNFLTGNRVSSSSSLIAGYILLLERVCFQHFYSAHSFYSTYFFGHIFHKWRSSPSFRKKAALG